MVIVIDSQIAGISGDMLLSALVDLGANKSKIIRAIKISENHISGSTIKNIDFGKVKKYGIEATELILDIDDKTHERKGIEIQKCIENSLDEIGLSEKAKTFAKASIETLIDIIGTATAIDDLKLFEDEFVSTPVAVGGGTLTFSHGTTSNPASAILEILKNSGIIISGGQVKEELTTPTGASMLASLTKTCLDFYPKMKVKSIGYGAGKKNFDGFSNVLKIIQGEKTKDFQHDMVQVLETNVDDVSGEVLGNLIEKIMAYVAKDVTITSAITQKGRPTKIVSVICDSESMNAILELLVSETGTLGVRVRTSERYTVPRTIEKISITIQGSNFQVTCKIVYDGVSIKNFKVESDDIKLISNTINQSFKKTEELIRTAIKEKLGLK